MNQSAERCLEIQVEKLVFGGDGLARIGSQVVLAPFLLPGEQARVQVKAGRGGTLRGWPVEILVTSPERVAPGCDYFTRCGGCHYQHARYEYQLRQKEQILRETFVRLARLQLPGEMEIVSGPQWSYRNRTQFHMEGGRVGFRAVDSHALCPIERCPISSPRINEALRALNRMARSRRFPPFVEQVEIFTNEEQLQLNVVRSRHPVARWFFHWCEQEIPGMTGALDYPVNGDLFRVSPHSFFQVNRFLLQKMQELVSGSLSGESAVDLYAGVGFFTLPLARRFRHVTAVESGRSAVGDLAENARRSGSNVQVMQSTAADYLRGLDRPPDVIVADPPRAGLQKAVTAELLRLKPRQIILVSCDAATLARDVAKLCGGGYHIVRATLIDLFPQTYHMETVLALQNMQ